MATVDAQRVREAGQKRALALFRCHLLRAAVGAGHGVSHDRQSLAGRPGGYDTVSSFFTEVFGTTIKVFGDPSHADELHEQGTLGDRLLIRYGKAAFCRRNRRRLFSWCRWGYRRGGESARRGRSGEIQEDQR